MQLQYREGCGIFKALIEHKVPWMFTHLAGEAQQAFMDKLTAELTVENEETASPPSRGKLSHGLSCQIFSMLEFFDSMTL